MADDETWHRIFFGLGREALGRHALRLVDHRVDGAGLAGADRGVEDSLGVLQVFELPVGQIVAEIRDVGNRFRIDAAKDCACAIREAGHHHFDLQEGRGANDAFGLARLLQQGLPVVELLERLVDHDVCAVAEDLFLEVGSKAAHHAEHRDQHARRDCDRQDRQGATCGQKAGLLCAKVARGDHGAEADPFER